MSGALSAGALIYYYILAEYRVSNEMLTEDIYVRLLFPHGLPLHPLYHISRFALDILRSGNAACQWPTVANELSLRSGPSSGDAEVADIYFGTGGAS